MTDITIPAEIIGDPEYDSDRGTLTFFGESAARIAQILSDAREKRERYEREAKLEALVHAAAVRFAHKDTSASSLLGALQHFADTALEIFEVQR